MGCWFGTCAVTQLPIHNGEKVRLVFIALNGDEDGDSDGFCHPTGLAYPITVAMPGVYDDYGGVILDQPLDEIAVLSLKHAGVSLWTGEGNLVEILRDDKPMFKS